nr:serine hydrolase domain-containing protein [Sphingomicrobium sediminis]
MLASPALAQPLSEAEREAVDAIISSIEVGKAPGYAIGVVRGGETVFEATDGLADMSHGNAITPDTVFNIASVAKQFTAMMILQLAEDGRIDLDEDFRTYLPNAMPGIEDEITVRQLLRHRSGIRDIFDLWGLTGITWYENRLRNREAMALLNRQTDLNFAPGSDFLYSNSNYILLAEMIANVTGEPFYEVANGFFASLGMDDTLVRRRYGVVIPDLARGYMNFGSWLENPDIANTQGDGFVYSSLTDQLAYEAILQGAPGPLAPELIELSQSRPEGGGYGFGLEHTDTNGLHDIYHQGSTGAYNAYTLRYPEQRLSIVVLSNASNLPIVQAVNNIGIALLGDALPPAPPPSQPSGPRNVVTMEAAYDAGTLAAMEGRYVNAETDTVIVLEQGEGMAFTMSKNGRARDAVADGYDRLVWNNYVFRGVRDEAGNVIALSVDNNRIRNVRFDRED